MNICMIGCGYVGLVSGTCFANLGNTVTCVDSDRKRIEDLKKGILPIFEPGLKEMVEINVKEKRLFFTSQLSEGIKQSQLIFLAVGTPQSDDGRADLSAVFAVAEEIGKYLEEPAIIVAKSTVPVGTCEKIQILVNQLLKKRGKAFLCEVVSNPEFLREGEAIKDFMNPDRIVLGVSSKKAEEMMRKLYSGIERTGKPVLVTDVKSSELIKYASNAMLATRISFMNILARLCESIGGDVKEVAKGIGLDDRIGPRFLQAGIGYGGSCFPKDVLALISTLQDHECDASLLEAVHTINIQQRRFVFDKLLAAVGPLKGKTIALWGLSFKPKTDDIRDAPSLTLIDELRKEKVQIQAFDPIAAAKVEALYPDIIFGKTPYETIKNCDALVIVTEWDEFRALDLQAIKALLKTPVIIDSRNIYDPDEMEALGFHYQGVGR